jgi:hypothetical protein
MTRENTGKTWKTAPLALDHPFSYNPRPYVHGGTMQRRIFLTMAAAGLAAPIFAQQPGTGEGTLKDTLVFGLRPRQPADYAFIDTVIAKVDDKTLPLDLVIAIYRWSLSKKPYPYPFFERALKVKAAALGVEL